MVMEEHIFYWKKFWIIQGRRAIKRILRQCVKCLRFTSKRKEVDPSALPSLRVNMTQVFDVTGVDLAGPLYMKNGSKCWVVLFTCAVSQAVHLDFVMDLSTEAFINCFHSFVKLRGRASVVYSDNGTNFHGTVNLFKRLQWEKIERDSTALQIKWKFNPPTAAWWGGWWERLIRTTKDLLKRIIGRARLDYEDFRTCLAHVQAVINDRPLTTVSEDSKDLILLTPALFLQGIQQTGFLEVENVDSTFLRANFKLKKQIFQEIRARFRREYLSQLLQRGRERKDSQIKFCDLVLIGEDNKKRLEWAIGRIIEVIPERDGKVRVAKVKTSTGVLTRPLQRLYPLKISSNPEQAVPIPTSVKRLAVERAQTQNATELEPVERRSRFGRRLMTPRFY